MKHVYVTGISKKGDDVNTRAFNFPDNADPISILQTMKAQGNFRGWQVITAIYNLENCELIEEFQPGGEHIDMFMRVFDYHCRKNAAAKRFIHKYEFGKVTLKDCLLGIIETLEN